MSKKNRARQRAARARMRTTGERYTTAWRNVDPNEAPVSPVFTPVKQDCGCVIDWGWDSRSVAPPLFIHWCMQMPDVPCPWHGGLSSPLPDGPEGDLLCVIQSGTRALFYDVTDQVMRTPPGHVPGSVPTHFRRWLYENDPDPMNAWLDQRLTDIVLNRGADTIAALDRPMAQRLPTTQPQTEPVAEECARCAFSSATGGILCVCGHDWGCHADGTTEPCKHCPCPDMCTPEQVHTARR
jgi:hypothetical protein